MSEYIQPDNTIDVISSSNESDYKLFFSPILENTKPLVMDAKKISDILIALKLAPSRTWCKKNNWDWDIEPGYSEITFGFKKVRICILMPFEVTE